MDSDNVESCGCENTACGCSGNSTETSTSDYDEYDYETTPIPETTEPAPQPELPPPSSCTSISGAFCLGKDDIKEEYKSWLDDGLCFPKWGSSV